MKFPYNLKTWNLLIKTSMLKIFWYSCDLCVYIYMGLYRFVHAYMGMYTYIPIFSRVFMYIYVHVRVNKCIGIYKDFLFNMHLGKLLTDFRITSILYFNKIWLGSGFLAFHLQLKVTRVTIIHIFNCNFTRYMLSVYYLFLLFISS